jgi:hypothetical protein
MKRRWFVRLSALALILAVIMAGLLAVTGQHGDLGVLQSDIKNYRMFTTAVRLSAIALIALAWPKLVRASEQRGHISLERGVELQALRWRIVTWLLLIEALVGQNLISAVWPNPTGASA